MARPVFHKTSGRVTELRVVDEGAVPASAPATSWLFVLPVAARRWVSTDNTWSQASVAPCGKGEGGRGGEVERGQGEEGGVLKRRVGEKTKEITLNLF